MRPCHKSMAQRVCVRARGGWERLLLLLPLLMPLLLWWLSVALNTWASRAKQSSKIKSKRRIQPDIISN